MTANAAKAALAFSTAGISLLSKKGRSFGKGKIDGGSIIIRLDEITGYDLLEHTGNRTDSKKSINGVGAATSIMGIGVGAAHIGSNGISDSTGVIEDISAQINTDNLENPILQISFLNEKTTRDTEAYKQGLNNANELINTLQMLEKKGLLGIEVPEESPVDNMLSDANLEKLKKLKELLDLGVLSQEEFDAKKAEILGL